MFQRNTPPGYVDMSLDYDGFLPKRYRFPTIESGCVEVRDVKPDAITLVYLSYQERELSAGFKDLGDKS